MLTIEENVIEDIATWMIESNDPTIFEFMEYQFAGKMENIDYSNVKEIMYGLITDTPSMKYYSFLYWTFYTDYK